MFLSSIKSSMMQAGGTILGLALTTVVLLTVAGLGLVNANTSANLVSAATVLSGLLALAAVVVIFKIFD